ncbi:MAG TPA: outer membrane protein assembly factor BamD [Pyrinomonadaceae bacterium]|nr:outer membrane protein assembly factor BamD [Pyrinomonadaceae bacterium]
MKPVFFFISLSALLLLNGVVTFGQRNVAPVVDPILEADARHNLDVARQAFRLKKAYKGVLMRFEETFAAYPEFSNMEEFLYLAGMSSYYLSKNEGKQKVNLKIEKEREKYNPEKLREDAIAYFSMMLERNPDSSYKNDAERVLKDLRPAQQ